MYDGIVVVIFLHESLIDYFELDRRRDRWRQMENEKNKECTESLLLFRSSFFLILSVHPPPFCTL